MKYVATVLGKHHSNDQNNNLFSSGLTAAWNVNLNQTVMVPKAATYPQTTLQDNPCIGPGIAGQGKLEDMDKEKQVNPKMAASDALGIIASVGIGHTMYLCGLEH